VRALHTPGHTPEHLTFVVTDRGGGADAPIGIVTGDFVFVGDLGRPDLLESAAGERAAAEPAAHDLYRSVRRLADLPDFLQLWPGHGAGSACGKALGAVPHSTLGYERRFNYALQNASEPEDIFVRDILADQPEPPLYFARMKRENRSGPALLKSLPQPSEIDPGPLADLAQQEGIAVVDTRDRQEYIRGHLPGSILAPFDKTFPTVVGSFVMPGEPIYLVATSEDVEVIVRNLVRIGLDDVRGFATPEALTEWAAGADRLRMMKAIDFDELDGRRHYSNVLVLDVRRRDEFERKHIPGAKHVPHVRLRDHADELPRDKTILVHCQTGVRSAVAAAYLHNRGFCVAYVADDFDHWKERHLEEGATSSVH
jgi:hydroxyacylglutathione hydrolase